MDDIIELRKMKDKKQEKEERIKELKEKVKKVTDALGKKIDREIRSTVVYLNALSILTTGSCQGHFRKDLVQGPFIDIGLSEPKEAKRNKELVKKTKLLLKKFYKIKKPLRSDVKIKIRKIGIFNAIRLEPKGENKLENLSTEEKKLYIKLAQKEFKRFTKFLENEFKKDC